ncbi:MAG: ABC transporter permease, partial [Alphaproteobacteria bacterium]
MALPAYASLPERIWYYAFRVLCGLIFLFLIAPIIIIIPLSFNIQPYFTFTQGMLSLDPEAYSMRWYADIVRNGMAAPDALHDSAWWSDMWNNAQWVRSARNSFFIAGMATLLATTLGTVAALGLSRSEMPFRGLIMGILISPMIVPLIITATGMFFFYSQIGIAKTYFGIIVGHAALGTPFVIITVTATL